MAKARRLAYIENMRRDDVIARLKEAEPALRGLGVAALYLFGSHARDEATPDSDVDVFVDVAPGAAFGLRPYMGAFRVLEDAFERKAEIGYSTRDALSPYIRADVERDALRIF
jgi:predicted nucleotidyltransferase